MGSGRLTRTDRLKGIAAWMKINGEAIYETRAIAPYKEGKVCFTQKKAGGVVYAIYLSSNEEDRPPRSISLKSLQPAAGAEVTMLGVGSALSWKSNGNGVLIGVPESVRQHPPCEHAWVIKISKAK